MKVTKTREFIDWFFSLRLREQAQVDARLYRIEHYHHFDDVKDLSDGLVELRWKNGWRVYFTHILENDDSTILLVLGGLKNAQKKDIKQARLLAQKYSCI